MLMAVNKVSAEKTACFNRLYFAESDEYEEFAF